MTPGPTTGESENAPSVSARRSFLRGGLLGGVVGVTGGMAAGMLFESEPKAVVVPPRPAEPIEKPLPEGAHLSYAQFGEDLIANSLFYSINITKPTYMDVGAYEPIISNNTYFFYQRGARGLLVEPNVAFTEKLKATRPGDTVLAAGIGITDVAEADYYVMSQPQQSTFDKAHAEKFVREKGCKIERVVKMPLININRAMTEHFKGTAPDYLSIDVEGLEFAILKTIDFKRFRPKVICIETLVANTLKHNPEITAYMTSPDRGYEVRGMSYPNTFYMDKQLLK